MADEEVLLLAPALVDDSNASLILGPGTFTSNPETYRKQLAATRTGADGSFRFDLPGPGNYLVFARTAGGATGSSSVYTLAAGQSASDVGLVLPAGASVSGHVTVAGGSAAGLRLWIGTQSEDFAWMQACERAVTLASDGSYHLTDLAAGAAKVRVLLPADESFAGGGFARSNSFSTWVELGALTLVDGASLVQDFTLPAAPGRLTLDVTVNGAPAAGLAFLAEQAVGGDRQGFELEGESGPGGVCGPMLAFAGPWSVLIRSQEAGWLFDSGVTSLVTAGGNTRVAVDVTTVSGSLRFLDASGQPLVNREVILSPDRPDRPNLAIYPRRFRTDALGRAELALTTGQYRFTLDTSTPGAVLQWTATGPASADLEL
ncbi:MAG: carboxypeptidase-like regulatory domain-containing protein [Planctomycetota bacterium]